MSMKNEYLEIEPDFDIQECKWNQKCYKLRSSTPCVPLAHALGPPGTFPEWQLTGQPSVHALLRPVPSPRGWAACVCGFHAAKRALAVSRTLCSVLWGLRMSEIEDSARLPRQNSPRSLGSCPPPPWLTPLPHAELRGWMEPQPKARECLTGTSPEENS